MAVRIEAVPSLILSVVVFFYLTDRPADATWLDPTNEPGWSVVSSRNRSNERRYVATA